MLCILTIDTSPEICYTIKCKEGKRVKPLKLKQKGGFQKCVLLRELKNMNIREGDPLEIFIEDGWVVFKKYSLLSSFAPQAAHIQKVLSINGISASVFDNSSLLCGPRPFGMSKTPDEWFNIRNWGTEWKGKSLFVTPIIAEGEVIGFICYKNDKESAHDMVRLSAQFLAQFAEN